MQDSQAYICYNTFALQLVRQELEGAASIHPQSERAQWLAAATAALRDDYADGGELTMFTSLGARGGWANSDRCVNAGKRPQFELERSEA